MLGSKKNEWGGNHYFPSVAFWSCRVPRAATLGNYLWPKAGPAPYMDELGARVGYNPRDLR